MCKDILALMGQGVEAQESKTTESIADRRTSETEKADSVAAPDFTLELRAAYHLVLIPRAEASVDFNSLLYDVAAFNFTKFMIKDFDISQTSIGKNRVIDISQLESADEARWYESMLLAEPSLQGRITLDKIERIVISDDNLKLIGNGRTIDEYLLWWNTVKNEE